MPLDITGPYRYPAARTDWLELCCEEILEPERPIVDSHHHVWEQQDNPYLLSELKDDLNSGHNILESVCVEAKYGYLRSGAEELKCVGETENLVKLAEEAKEQGVRTDVCSGIVGFADLMLGKHVSVVIEAHLAVAGTRFKGVRHSVARDPDFPDGIVIKPAPEGLLGNKQYRAGLARIAEYGLSYDAMLYHRQIPELTTTAHALPQLPIILDHMGCIIGVGPYRGHERESFEVWRKDLRELAGCTNVNIKLGGLGMVICGATYHGRSYPPTSRELAETWRPYIETCIEFFGVEQCMFESNFPVDKAMFSYPVLWNAYKRLVSGASDDEKSALFHDTATRIYRLEGHRVIQ